MGGGGAQGRGARDARGDPAHRRRPRGGRRRAREDAAAVQAGRRRARWPAGSQYVPWVHLDDVVGALLFLLDGGRGTYNVTAPEPVTNSELSKALGRALKPPGGAAGARARDPDALRRDGVGRHDRRARGAHAAAGRGLLVRRSRTSTTPSGQRSAEPARRRTPRRPDDRLLGDPREGVRRRAAHVGVLPLLLRGPVLWLLARGEARTQPPAAAGVRSPASSSQSTSSRGTTRSTTSAPGSRPCSATSRSSSSA